MHDNPPHPLTRKIVLASGDYLQLFQSKPFPTSVVYQRLTSIYLPIYPQSKASCESSLAPNDYKDTFMYIQGYIYYFFGVGIIQKLFIFVFSNSHHSSLTTLAFSSSRINLIQLCLTFMIHESVYTSTCTYLCNFSLFIFIFHFFFSFW